MLIRVVYSDNQILFCNADCVAVNLLGYVRRQTGNLDCEVDLADETGRPWYALSDHCFGGYIFHAGVASSMHVVYFGSRPCAYALKSSPKPTHSSHLIKRHVQ